MSAEFTSRVSQLSTSRCITDISNDRHLSVVPKCDLTIYCALTVRPSFTADVYWLPQTVFIVTFVRWSCSIYCNSATLIIFIATTTCSRSSHHRWRTNPRLPRPLILLKLIVWLVDIHVLVLVSSLHLTFQSNIIQTLQIMQQKINGFWAINNNKQIKKNFQTKQTQDRQSPLHSSY